MYITQSEASPLAQMINFATGKDLVGCEEIVISLSQSQINDITKKIKQNN